MAGNQLGKTLAGGFEVAMHATGDTRHGGRANASTVPLSAGRAVSLAKLSATRCRRCLSGVRAR